MTLQHVTREKKCKVCGTPFHTILGFRNWCSPVCGSVLAEEKRSKAVKVAAVKERKADAIKRETQKTPTQLETECRAIVQKIARIRDRDDGCISCHMPANYGGLWHGSHFRPAGNNAAVQFHLWNIHKSCAQCNLFKGGNLSAYRPSLVQKIGTDRVEWLESQTQVVKTSVPYLIRFKVVMSKRLRRIEKRLKEMQE